MSDDEPDRDALIERLKRTAATTAGGRMIMHESAELTLDQREDFWRQVVQFESAGTTDLVIELKRVGVELSEPDVLDDEAVHAALWTVIHALAGITSFWTRRIISAIASSIRSCIAICCQTKWVR